MDMNKTKSSFLHVISIAKKRVPTVPGKPGKMRVTFPVMEISWNFKILKNMEK